MKYLNRTEERDLTQLDNNNNTIKWYANADFTVNPDFKSHNGISRKI